MEIYGVSESNRDLLCANHVCCGEVLLYDSVIWFKTTTIIADLNVEEVAVEAVLVTGGIDGCRVGFLPKDMLDHTEEINGKLVQLYIFLRNSSNARDIRKNDACRGVCRAYIIDAYIIDAGPKLEEEEEDVCSYDSSKAH